MSKQVDERVVSMQFDNKNFESNVATTMSTLDKLKEKLNFTGASKGLDNINTAAKNVDMTGLGNAVETVRTRFSALEVMGVTALANITNSAVNAGKRIISALTVEPIGDGFKEYEMTLNAVQTTMAATGKTAAEVEKELKKLDEYADKTVYGTADMLNNLPKFTNAGVELENATKAMIGIANATALAGGDAGKASIAFYNLGQAIGTGYLTRMDYNSINNAGIATMEWKNQMVEAAISAGTLKKAGEDLYEAGGKTFTLQQLFIDGLQKQWATTDVMMKVFEDYGNEQTEIGKKAYASAQDIKTFTMMMESLKATAGTGWKDTWQLIFGDLDQAKELWTGLTNLISGFITKMADFRNGLIKSAMSSPFGQLSEKLKTITGPIEKVTDVTKKLGKTAKEYEEVVGRIIGGEYGNGQSRWDKLTEEGYDWAHAQNLVNEKLGVSLRRTTDYKEAQEEVNKTQSKTIEQLLEMSDAELKHAYNLEDHEIAALRELEEQSKKTGIPIKDLLEDMDQLSGRSLLINSFKNIGSAIGEVAKAAKQAWQDIFPPKTIEERAAGIYNLIAALHKFTTNLVGVFYQEGKLTDTGNNLVRTLKGIFAIVDVLTTIFGGAFKIAFKAVTQLLGMFNLDILDVTAIIGDAIVKFRDWFEAILDFTAIFEIIIPYILLAADAIKEFVRSVKDSGFIKLFVSNLKSASDAFVKWIDGFKDAENIPEYIANGLIKALKLILKNLDSLDELVTDKIKNIPNDMIAGLVNGLWTGASEAGKAAVQLAISMVESICEFLGIHSPSTKFMEIGGNIIDGLVQGLQNGFSKVGETISNIGSKIVEFFKNLDFGTIFAGGLATALTVVAIKLANVVSQFAAPLDGLGSMFEDVGTGAKKMLKGIASNFKAKAWEHRSEAMLNFAKAIAILAASVYVLAQLDSGQLWTAVGAIGALAGIIALLAGVLTGVDILINKYGSGSGLKMGSFALSLLALAGSILIIAIAMKKIGSMTGGELGKATAVVIGISVLITALAYMTDFTGHNMDEVGKMILKLSFSLLLLVIVIKAIGLLNPEDLTIGLITIGLLGAFFVGLMAATKLFDSGAGSAGSVLLKMAASMLLMVIVIRAISMLDPEALAIGIGVMWMFSAIIMTLLTATNLFDKEGQDCGSTLLKMSAALMVMAFTVKILGSIDAGSLVKGTVAIAALAGIMVGLVAATQLVGEKEMKRIGSTLLMMSLSIGILGVVATLLGFVDTKHLAKGIIAVGMLGAIMALMIWATRGANDCKGNLIVMTVAIGIMAAAVAALSLIDTSKLAASTAALGGLMLAFAAIAKASGSAGSWKSMASLIIMTVIVGVLALIIRDLSELDTGSALASAGAISMLMVAISASLFIVSKMGTTLFSSALKGIILLTAMVAPLLAFCWALKSLDGVMLNTETILLLVGVMVAMTALLLVLTPIGWLGAGALAGIILLTAMVAPLLAFCWALEKLDGIKFNVESIAVLISVISVMIGLLKPLILIGFLAIPAIAGIIALTAMVVPLSVFALALAILPDITGAINNAMLLTSLMNVMTDMLIRLAPIAPLALIGVAAMSGLTLLMGRIGAMATAVGALMEKFPSLQEFLNTGLPVLTQLAGAIGTMIGEFVGNALESISSRLPQIGSDLGAFMINAMPFITGAKMIDSTMIEGVKGLAGAIMALTAADLLEGLLNFDGQSFARLGTELSSFMMNAMPFIIGASLLKPDMTTGVKNLAETILILTGADIIDRLTSWITGGSSLADFGAEIAAFGPYMAQYAAAVAGIDGGAVKASAKAAKTLVEMANLIPNEGGLISKVTGENDLAQFGAKIALFGGFFRTYANQVIGLDTEAVNNSVKSAKKVIEMAGEIPNSGGLIAAVTGDNDLAQFGAKLAAFGIFLKMYSTNVAGLDEESINISVKATKKLLKIADAVPETGGLIAKITGDNDLASFGAKLVEYSTSLSTYATNVSGMTSDSIDASIKATEKLIKMVKEMSDLDTSGVKDFKKAVKSLSETKLSDFVSTFSESYEEVTSIGSDLINSIIKGVTSSTESLSSAAKTAIESVITASKSKFESFKTLGSNYATNIADGISGKESAVKSAMTSLISAATTSLATYYTTFYNAGGYLVSGFCSGISANTWQAEAKAAAMAKAAADAAEEALDINSPSKVFRAIGYSIPEGFAMGIDKLSGMVANSSFGMGDTAVSAVNDSIARIVDIINSDIDSQPTIRPVLDLTDVRAGVSSIGSMLSGKTTLSVGSQTAGVIAASMTGQNGKSNDVVSAIKDLRTDIANMPRNNYNINGITYDDGSNIANTIGTLVREARIERRV